MCTLTVIRDSERVLVTMNRDERRDRVPERSPRLTVDEETAVAWMAPRDGTAGGTWMGTNEFGVVGCLLNQYGPGPERHSPATKPSRGEIVPRLLTRGDWDSARGWLEGAFDPAPYEGFRLVLASPDETLLVVWRGTGAVLLEPCPNERFFLSSSSWNQDEVLPWRRSRFDEWVAAGAPTKGRIPAIHLERPEGMESWAPLMGREQSATRSVTQIELGRRGHGLRMRWWPVSDGCVSTEPGGEAALALKAPSERQIAP